MTKLQIINFNDKGYISSEKAKKILGALESRQVEADSDTSFLLILQDLIMEEWEEARILFLSSFNR